MAGLSLTKSGEYIARKGIPADVRETYARLYGVRWEAILRLPAGTPKSAAKARHGEWLAEIETRISAIRAAAKGEGQPLTRMNAFALAGRWYMWFVGKHVGDPGTPKQWREMSDYLAYEVLLPEAPESYHEAPKADPNWEWAKEPEVRQAVRPRIAELARVASFLADQGLALNADAYALFVDAVSDNLQPAIHLLERRAAGDYSPDDIPETFPAFTTDRVTAADGFDCWQLFEEYVKAVKPADGTVSRWRAVFLNMKAQFTDRAAASISEAEARTWIKGLVTPDRAPTTVREVWLAASRSVFGWALNHKHVHHNPFTGIKVDVPKRSRSRETKAFEPSEVRLILQATISEKDMSSATARVRRWVPWLCAYSGARAGEITQLRGKDVARHESGFYSMKLTPDAGTVKTRQTRTVPIHEHIVAQGFIKMVNELGDGPLFYNPDTSKQRKHNDLLKPSRSRAATARAHLSTWVRELGVADPEVSPTHGWRHSFKAIAERAGISEKVHDAITGHAPASEGRKYGTPTLEDMAAALKKFPRYKVS
ncbi:tyrosine-type recombinase/integrase [Tardiphaga sp. 37S4]|uniref:tyrosine-type recombinase/integrase n=1 Tax=Tardiphaga sp. 37S4 TaxID=1404741 RepID=UPI001E39ACD1|nr:tyrosine-type recombinase/integrase [Tardiphaga sp. 37S4]UFS76032.1 tyrosine-type recombinase/integrase [Tardiphaga sp. 37S4]